MKHRCIKTQKVNDDRYTLHCVLGNFHISREKKEWVIYPYSKNSYTLSILKELKNGELKDIRYKSLDQAVTAIQKSCNEFINNIKFYCE